MMMHGFEDVTFEWRDEKYTVPADQQMMLIAKVESALSGDTGRQAIDLLTQPGGPPHMRLAMAYETALEYAGAIIKPGEVYLAIMEDFANGSGEAHMKIASATMALLCVISPPIGRAMKDDGKPKKKVKTKD